MQYRIINRDVTQNPHDVFQLVTEYKNGTREKQDYISFGPALIAFTEKGKAFTADDLAQLSAFYIVKINYPAREAVYIVELYLGED